MLARGVNSSLRRRRGMALFVEALFVEALFVEALFVEALLVEALLVERDLCVGQFAHNDGGVVAAKAKAVAHRDAQLAFPWLKGSVIEVALRIRVFQIDRRRDHIPGECVDRDRQFDAAAGAERMAQIAFRAGNTELLSVVAKHAFDRPGFSDVAQRRACTMGVDVVDLIVVEPSIVEGRLHRDRGPHAFLVAHIVADRLPVACMPWRP